MKFIDVFLCVNKLSVKVSRVAFVQDRAFHSPRDSRRWNMTDSFDSIESIRIDTFGKHLRELWGFMWIILESTMYVKNILSVKSRLECPRGSRSVSDGGVYPATTESDGTVFGNPAHSPADSGCP